MRDLQELNPYKSVGLERLHPRTLRELTAVTARLPSITFEGWWRWGEVPIAAERQTLHPSSKKAQRASRGKTGLSATIG